MRQARFRALASCAVLASLVTFTLPVEAHAKLVRAEPRPRSAVKTAPRVVRAWFNEELDPKGSALTVWDARGKRVDDGKGGVDLNDLDHRSMLARLRSIGPGQYTVKWTAVSADDKNVARGTFRFTVAAPMTSSMGGSMGSMELPPLRLIAPASGALVNSPVAVVFETAADLAKMSMSTHMEQSSAHVHIDIDKRVNMPTIDRFVKVGTNRYMYDLGRVMPGRHTIRLYWADTQHKLLGSAQTVTVTVK